MADGSISRKRLFWITLARLLSGAILVGVILFWPAGTLRYWEAWLYIGLLFGPAIAVSMVLLVRDPALLERRMRSREREAAQKTVILLSSILLIAMYLIPGLDRRYGWSTVPTLVVILADGVALAGYVLFILTIRANRYASRVVEVQENQPVISSGPYALVRHPMYTAVTLIFGASPLALGSWWALIPAALLPLILVARIANEEKLLVEGLPGYAAYRQKVRYRMIPFVW